MAVLQTVFNSREFDFNDNVLMEFNNHFDEESKNYKFVRTAKSYGVKKAWFSDQTHLQML